MNNGRKSHSRGFTLIEIMIAVAIIGLLASIVSVSYKNYTARAYLTEVAVANRQFKTSTQYFLLDGSVSLADLTPSERIQYIGFTNGWGSQYITNISVAANGSITVQLSDDLKLASAAGISYTLTPTIGTNNQIVNWACVSNDPSATIVLREICAD